METGRRSVNSQKSFIFMAFVFSQQRVCHNNKPMKTVFLQGDKQASVAVHYRA
jgi:hypothetical protein